MPLVRGGAAVFGGQRLSFALLVALVLLRLADPWEVEGLRLRVFDSLQQLFPGAAIGSGPAAEGAVVVVEIDDASLAAQGQWPWPRNRLAALVDRIAARSPAAVGLDILLGEADRLSPARIAQAHPELAPALREALAGLPSNDDILAQSFADRPIVTALVAGFGDKGIGVDALPTSIIPSDAGVVEAIPDYRRLLHSLAPLEAAASGRGVTNLAFDPDGVMRQVALVARVGETLLPSLTLEVLRIAEGVDQMTLVAGPWGAKALRVGQRSIPVSSDGKLWMNFSLSGPATRFSAGDVLRDDTVLPDLAGRIVLLGVTAAGVADYVPTTIGRARPGLLVHAEALESILMNRILVRPPETALVELLLFAAAGLTLIAARRRARARSTFLLFAGLLVAMAVFSCLAFLGLGWLLDASFAIIATTLLYSCVVSLGLVEEERARRIAAREAADLEQKSEARIRALQGELLRSARRSSAGQLSAVLSHELNQPLAAIHNFLQASRRLAAKTGAAGTERLDGLLEKALGQTRRSSDILQGMRDVLDRGELHLEPTDANALVREALALCRDLPSMQGLTVELDLAPDLPAVAASSVQIHQVLVNLIQNAAEAMRGESGTTLRMTTEAAGEGRVAFTVSDAGPGLSAEVRDNLFQPFLTTKPDGTGLGLSICRAIAAAHGGGLTAVDSSLGGAAFRFTLHTPDRPPRSESEPDARVPTTADQTPGEPTPGEPTPGNPAPRRNTR